MRNRDDPVDPRPNRERRRASARRAAALGSATLLTTATGALTLLAGGVPAGATTFTVTTCSDGAPGSLRDAISDAGTNPGADTITITASCPEDSPASIGLPMTITGGGGLTITGPGADDFVLDGGGASQILMIENGTGPVSISGVTFRNAAASGGGGAMVIGSAGDVTLTGIVFADNESSFCGGALYAQDMASLTIADSAFLDNVAGGGGGALYVARGGDITISGSTFAGNTASGGNGGAMTIYDTHADFSMTNSTVTGNTASGRGSGVFLAYTYGDAEFLFDTVTDNTAATGGGITASGQTYDLTLAGNVVSGNTLYQVAVGSGWTVTTHDNDFHGAVIGVVRDATDLDVDPGLGPLGDHGGPTPTRVPLPGSPLVDRGPTVFPAFPGDAADQRGLPCVRVYAGRSDIGAVEVQPEPGPGPEPAPDPEPSFTG